MAQKPVVTNAMRLLKAAGVAFDTVTYEVDESDLSGVTVAKKTGMKPEEVFRLSGFTRDEFLELMTKDHPTYSRARIIRSV